jgi:hypothetical protein
MNLSTGSSVRRRLPNRPLVRAFNSPGFVRRVLGAFTIGKAFPFLAFAVLVLAVADADMMSTFPEKQQRPVTRVEGAVGVTTAPRESLLPAVADRSFNARTNHRPVLH